MKRIARSLAVALFFVAFVAGGATPAGCSCNTPPQPARKQVTQAPVVSSLTSVRRQPPPLIGPGEPPPKVELMVLNDRDAGIVFYFETDGRHATALRRDGSVIWHRDVVEATYKPGITKDGKKQSVAITFAGAPLEWQVEHMRKQDKGVDFIAVSFNTKEFGLINKLTGEYHSLGND